jgi:GDP-4-dehydro-6-deoxy-D-mannose reductase
MSLQKIVVTGVNGFVGKHLVRELKERDIRVIGVDRAPEAEEEISGLLDDYHACDLSKKWPDTGEVTAVIHLAGLAAVGPSFDRPQLYLDVNSAIMTNMAEFCLKAGHNKTRLVVVSSGAIYDPLQPMPLYEDSSIGFTSPYAVSKVLVENQCAYYKNRGLDCVVARPFNHIGPGQKPGFLLPDLYEQIKTCQETSQPLKVGNLKTKRDYTDVRDVVRAYRLLATSDSLNHSTYNICSGKNVSGEEMLNLLLDSAGVIGLKVVVDESKIRPNDPEEITGDNTRLKSDTGWLPEISLKKTVKDFLGA